jgi:hypothetical protein
MGINPGPLGNLATICSSPANDDANNNNNNNNNSNKLQNVWE